MILQIIKIKVITLHINLGKTQEEVTCPMSLTGDLGTWSQFSYQAWELDSLKSLPELKFYGEYIFHKSITERIINIYNNQYVTHHKILTNGTKYITY